MSSALILLIALLLDAWLGEPAWLWSRFPHPAVLMGRLVKSLDQRLNSGSVKKAKGIVAVCVLVLMGLTIGWFLSLFGTIVEVVVLAILLAQRSLTEHLMAVANGLARSLKDGQRAVAMIVSRDTAGMTAPQVARSAIESGSENMSDGVVAPAFWFLIGGLPGLIVYKMVNTADSMIGYKNSRYAEFGWAAARLDDLLNLLPARLTGLLIALPGKCLTDWKAIARDAAKHRSPNAGWPEAAMARALDLSLAGPRSYDGMMQNFPWVHEGGSKSIGGHAITRACDMLWQAWGVGILLLVSLSAFC